jgi:hypothetical protein
MRQLSSSVENSLSKYSGWTLRDWLRELFDRFDGGNILTYGEQSIETVTIFFTSFPPFALAVIENLKGERDPCSVLAESVGILTVLQAALVSWELHSNYERPGDWAVKSLKVNFSIGHSGSLTIKSENTISWNWLDPRDVLGNMKLVWGSKVISIASEHSTSKVKTLSVMATALVFKYFISVFRLIENFAMDFDGISIDLQDFPKGLLAHESRFICKNGFSTGSVVSTGSKPFI